MKKIFILLVMSFILINMSSGYAQESVKSDGDPELILKQAQLYGERVIQVSFDGVDASLGQLTVTDNANRIVKFIEVFEIIGYPNTSSLNTVDMPNGEYTITLKTKIRTYINKVTLQ